MHIKQFREHKVRVPDPLRPGKRTFEDRLIPAGAGGIGHDGQSYKADEDGWFDVPPEVGEIMLKRVHRDPRTGSTTRFYTPEQVDEQVRLGAMDDDRSLPSPPVPKTRPAPGIRRPAAKD